MIDFPGLGHIMHRAYFSSMRRTPLCLNFVLKKKEKKRIKALIGYLNASSDFVNKYSCFKNVVVGCP